VPTLLDLAGVRREPSSCSLVHAIDSCADPLAELLYRYGDGARASCRGTESSSTSARARPERTALYDLATDPAEHQTFRSTSPTPQA
jgi:hypothetical protein